MGTDRDRSRPTKKFHRTANDEKHREFSLEPRPRMTYPSDLDLMLRAQQNPSLTTGFATGAPDLTAALLNDRCTQLFKEATAVLWRTKSRLRGNINPISFIFSLRTRPALQPWAAAIHPKPFITFFLVLRAARNAFIIGEVYKPSGTSSSSGTKKLQPYDTLPRAIDAFHGVDRFDWGGYDIVEWTAQRRVCGAFVVFRPAVVNRNADGDVAMGDGPTVVDDQMMLLFRDRVETSLRQFGAVVKEEVLDKALGDVIKRHQESRAQAAAARKKRGGVSSGEGC
ncbi:hypothetical protein C8A01DRAFT_38982 [Parachaetomium inaequale]|uniref:Uncharacterized protein n=1 Tax=Parachaetomium inaequale TaxID=2588326 RepID=A0AAN6PBS6_9PEZI|nr:hypothetical protein C8A01DRAFT_38982 [Parachaetomium inaequale]